MTKLKRPYPFTYKKDKCPKEPAPCARLEWEEEAPQNDDPGPTSPDTYGTPSRRRADRPR